MTGGDRHEEHFLCERCGTTYAWGGTCARCELPLADVTFVPEWQRTTVRTPPEYNKAFGIVSAAIGVIFCGWYAAFFFAGVRERGQTSGAQLLLLALLPILMAVGYTYRPLGELLRRRNAARRTSALQTIPIASAPEEGPVRIVGRARVIRPAHNPEHAACLAFEQSSPEKGGGLRVFRSNGGEFEIDDGSGMIAIVRAEHLQIVGGETRDGQLVIPLDATLEVVGDGAWELSQSDSVVSHTRSAARVLRIEGTQDRPVLLRMVPSPTQAPAPSLSGVRVSATEHAAEPDDHRSTETPRRATSVNHR
jgi:hypothetical protein